MEQSTNNNSLSSSFSLRKIPVTNSENIIDVENEKYLDKIKILELCNVIDEWEKELLFSDGGFFSLKGKDVKDKSDEFIKELEKFINSKISAMVFYLPESKNAVQKIKQIKIENIKNQMIKYESQELYEWEISVYNKAIDLSLQKALLYKQDNQLLEKMLKQGLSIIDLMADREKWNNKILKSKKEKYISEFYYSIIKAFIDEKNIKFFQYYEKYKDILGEEKKQELESIVLDTKNNIIAYNWSKEIFSYNWDNEKIDKEIKKLKDDTLEKLVKSYIVLLKNAKDVDDEKSKKVLVERNWDNIISLLQKEPDKALLYIDLTQDKNIINAQNKYINQFIKNGAIKTDIENYIQLLKEMTNDFDSFKSKQIDNYRYLFSTEDLNFFKNLQQEESIEKQVNIISDYKFLFNELKNNNIKKSEQIYEIILLFQQSLNEFKISNSKEADLEKKNKIIEIIMQRYKKRTEREGVDKDDSIINSSGK